VRDSAAVPDWLPEPINELAFVLLGMYLGAVLLSVLEAFEIKRGRDPKQLRNRALPQLLVKMQETRARRSKEATFALDLVVLTLVGIPLAGLIFGFGWVWSELPILLAIIVGLYSLLFAMHVAADEYEETHEPLKSRQFVDRWTDRFLVLTAKRPIFWALRVSEPERAPDGDSPALHSTRTPSEQDAHATPELSKSPFSLRMTSASRRCCGH
jgi:hypothetical protein